MSSATEQPVLTFASKEVRALCKSRTQYTRFPDLLRKMQAQGRTRSERALFKAYIDDKELASSTLFEIVNDVDNEPCPPADWVFINHYVCHEDVGPPTLELQINKKLKVHTGCDCTDEECDPTRCACRKMHMSIAPTPWAQKSLKKLPSAYTSKGLLHPNIFTGFTEKPPIWECNKSCGCCGECHNRVVGKGRTVGLTLFKTLNKGWGLRTMQALQAGQFVCIYAGELISEAEAEKRATFYGDRVLTSYVLDLDQFHIKYHTYIAAYKKSNEYDPHTFNRLGMDDKADKAMEWFDKQDRESLPDPLYTIDAGFYGNLSRYFNHSCKPNLTLVPVYTHERDLLRPFMAFFTITAVKQGEELTFDYAPPAPVETPETRADAAPVAGGKIASMPCQCGAKECRGIVWKKKGVSVDHTLNV